MSRKYPLWTPHHPRKDNRATHDFAGWLTTQSQSLNASVKNETDCSATTRRQRKIGVSLLEVMVVLTVIGILLSASAPSYLRSIEQTHADMSGANLRAIWNAQRLYWLENHTYANSLSVLESTDLLDPTIVSGSLRYSYAITFADASGFTAAASRIGSGHWSGQFVISENGQITGAVSAPGESNITPGFQ